MKYFFVKISHLIAGCLLTIIHAQAETFEDVIVVLKSTSLPTTTRIEQTLNAKKSINANIDLPSERRAIVNAQAKKNKRLARSVAKQYSIKTDFIYGNALLGFAAKITTGQKQQLLQDKRIRYISSNKQIIAQQSPVLNMAKVSRSFDDAQVTPWGISRLNGENATNTGAGIHIFVVDSGIDVDHPDLQAAIVGGMALVDCTGECSAPWDDDNEHGTHVAGIIAAQNNALGIVGVSPGVSLHAVKVLDNNNNGSTARIAAGIDYVTQETLSMGVVTIANISIGGEGSAGGECSASGYNGSTNNVNDAYYESFCNATNAGVIISASAGNFGVDGSSFLPTQFDDTVIAVSAAWGGPEALTSMNNNIANNGGVRPEWMPSANDNGDWWWDCSNYGDKTASWANHASAPITYGAPGYNILSTLPDNQYGERTGTSMAAPHSSGAIALYLKVNPQSADYSAFTSIRSTILAEATNTSHFNNSANVSDTGCGIAIRPHHEPYLALNIVKNAEVSTDRPISNAGNDQRVDENIQVFLTGVASDDGTIIQYRWQQLSGITVSLENSSSQNASFITPEVTDNQTLVFMLVSTDENGATGSDLIHVTVNNVIANEAPVANAGDDQTIEEGGNVTLDGSQSSDSDGSIVSYLWTQDSGTTVTLTNANSTKASFTSPNVDSNTLLSFTLTITDDKGDKSRDGMLVTITNKTVVTPPPVEQPKSGGGSIGILLFLALLRIKKIS